MSVPRTDAVRLLSTGLCAAALVSVITLTLIDRGATRAYSTPWIYLFWFAHVAPLVALALRTWPKASPCNFPRRAWCTLAGIFGAVVLLSAALSPFPAPSLLATLTPLSGLAAFFLIHDASHQNGEYLTESFLRGIALISAAIVAVSVLRWSATLISSGAYRNVATLLNGRNEFPLGHSNYTAGLSLLVIPWFGFLAWRSWGLARAGWIGMTALALIMLVSSGSRGGLLGAGALAVLALANARVNRRMLVLLASLGLVLVLALGYAHPRTRAMILSRQTQVTEPNASNVQRTAMALAGWRMGVDRPVLGYGPGLTPLVYPRYRAGLDGGVETALQLHSTPIQLWADYGIGGVACALAAFFLIWGERRASRFARLSSRADAAKPSRARVASASGTFAGKQDLQSEGGPNNPDGLPRLADQPRNDNATSLAGSGRSSDHLHVRSASSHPLATTALVSLGGYAVFAVTDYQLDVPIFTLAIATCVALIARSAPGVPSRAQQFAFASAALAVLLVIGFFGRRDPTPAMNVRALALGAEPAQADQAIQLLRQSLELNPNQEIAHFNLGWLLLVRDPAAAEKHFVSAAHLVPDKGGVYFGLALARLNQNPDNSSAVVHALALECLNDPRFLISPWWREPNLAALREPTIIELRELASGVALRLAARNDRRSRDGDYIAAVGEWLDGRGAPGEVLARSHTSGRVSYFAARPAIPNWKTAPVKAYHRERPGYPVLMRNLDLPVPVDLFQVQENSLATGELAALFPAKGWLPAPLLIELLEGEEGRKP